MKLHYLFPEPVYLSKLERKLTTQELKTINKFKDKSYLKKDSTSGGNNIISNDKYILEDKTLKNLKKDLYTIVLDYFKTITCTDNSVVPYITQSWVNYTETNQYHHIHNHHNSYLSGVFYINADIKVDKITFYKVITDTIKLNVAKYNIFNASSWWYPVKSKDVILFPSHLNHGVENKKGNKTRISLAFNVFLKGTIGNKNELTELIL